MNKQLDFDNTIRIPVITDLVRPGDPEVIKRLRSGASIKEQQQFEVRLKERIAELQSATGQSEYSGLARAHAIRSEGRQEEENLQSSMVKDYEQQMDKRRTELLRNLSSMLKEQQ